MEDTGSSGSFTTDIGVDVDDGESGYQTVLAPTTVTINRVNDAPVARPDGVHLSFDGDDFVLVADHPSLQMSNKVTMEAWINPTGSGTGSQIILNKEGEYELGIIADTGEILVAIAQSDDTWAWRYTGQHVAAGEWSHVAVAYDGVAGEAKTYINGQLVDIYSQSGAIGDAYPTFNDLTIGGRGNDADERFEGQIDDVRLWSTARTQGEVQAYLDGQLSGGEVGLVGNWRLDEAAGGTVLDQSAFGNDGVLGGAEGASATPDYQGYFTDQNTVLNIAAGAGVLANDSDVDGDSLAVTNLDTTGMSGNLSLNTADGSFSYDPNGAFDYLDAGEQATETFTYTANDGSMDSNVVTVTITITGVEDASVVTGTFTRAVSEGNVGDAPVTASAAIAISDVDASDSPAFNDVASTVGDNGYGSFVLSGGSWTYTLNQSAVQNLDAADVVNDTVTYTATDGSSRTITVSITGTDDNSVITGTIAGAVTEGNVGDTPVTATGSVAIGDVDADDSPAFNDVPSTAGDNAYGSFVLSSGTWTYTLDQSGVQDLDTGDVVNDIITYTATDGSTQQISVSITGTDDNPVITGTVAGAVTEGNVGDAPVTATGSIAISDADADDSPGFNDVASTTGDNGYGSFVLSGGTWTYTLDQSAVQFLDAGESVTDTITYTASDGATQVVTVTVNGSEDMPTLDNAIGDQAATEDTAFSFTFVATTFGDLDASDSLSFSATLSDGITSLPAWLSFVDNGNGTGTFSGTPTNGDVGTVSIRLVASDGSNSVSDSFDIVVANANDTPTIGGVDTGALTEDVDPDVDGWLEAAGALTISDPDSGESSFQAATVVGTYGSLTIDTAGNWAYSADKSQAGIQALDVGESTTDTLTVTAFDGTTHDITITINGAEDAPVITATLSGTVTEDGTLTDSGTLTISDVDSSDNPISFADMASTPGDNGYGSFALNSGTWTYTLNNGNATVQGLGAGDSLTDTYTFTATDGSTRTVTITIDGAEDAPILATNNPLSVPEEASRTITSAYLSATDSDNAPTEIVYTVTEKPGSGNALRLSGSTLNVGDTFTQDDIDNNRVSIYIDEDVMVDDFKFTISDGSTISPEYTFACNGQAVNDAPVNTVPGTQTVLEETATGIPGISVVDIDAAGADITTRLQVGAGNLDVILSGTASISAGSNGSGDLTIRGTVAEINATLASLTYTGGTDVVGVAADTLTVTTNDGGNTGSGGVLVDTDTVQINITNVNDAAQFGGSETGVVTEDFDPDADGLLETGGTLTVSDVDAGESSFQPGTVSGTYGSLTIDAAGAWTFSADNTQSVIQALDVAETLTDTLTVTAFDGTTHDITITIQGAEDTAVVNGTFAGGVTEGNVGDAAVTTTGSIAISDVDTTIHRRSPMSPAPMATMATAAFALSPGPGPIRWISPRCRIWMPTISSTTPSLSRRPMAAPRQITVSITGTDDRLGDHRHGYGCGDRGQCR